MGAIEEEIVRRFLQAAEGPSQNVDAMIGLVAADVEYRMNVPLAKPVRGREGPSLGARAPERDFDRNSRRE